MQVQICLIRNILNLAQPHIAVTLHNGTRDMIMQSPEKRETAEAYAKRLAWVLGVEKVTVIDESHGGEAILADLEVSPPPSPAETGV